MPASLRSVSRTRVTPAGFDWNHRPASIGLPGRLPLDYPAGFVGMGNAGSRRIIHHPPVFSLHPTARRWESQTAWLLWPLRAR